MVFLAVISTGLGWDYRHLSIDIDIHTAPSII